MFFTRMLYSCLVDADFLDTEAFMEGRPRAGGAVSMENLWERLQKHISGWFPPEGELNRQRCAILERCMTEGTADTRALYAYCSNRRWKDSGFPGLCSGPCQSPWFAAGHLCDPLYLHY